MDSPPLVLSPAAAQRLAAIRAANSAVFPSPKRGTVSPEEVNFPEPAGSPVQQAAGITESSSSVQLSAGLLDRPLPLAAEYDTGVQDTAIHPDGPASAVSWQTQRDVHTEVGVSLEVLSQLSLYSGSLVKVSAANHPNFKPHIARLLALDAPPLAGGPFRTLLPKVSADDKLPAKQQQPVAWLAPQLAFNLGLHCHLWPFLAPEYDQDSLPLVGNEEVLLERLDADGAGVGDTLAATLLQPGCGRVHVRTAEALTLARVRVPSVTVLPSSVRVANGSGIDEDGPADAPQLGPQGQPEEADDLEDSDTEEEEIVAAIQQYFQQLPRVVVEGDLISVSVPEASAESSLLQSLYGLNTLHSGPAAGTHLVHFRVQQLQPSDCGALAVDIKHTAVMLQGTCSSALPVGLEGYTAAAAELATSTPTAHTDAAFHESPLDRAAQNGSHAHTDSNGVTSQADSYAVDLDKERLQSGSAASSSGRVDMDAKRHPRQLGVDAGAAGCERAALAGVGPLLPTWHSLAHILAPIFHQGAAGLGLRVAVLLHGPAGAGKLTAVQAAAAALGVHVVPYNCHELKGQSDGKTAAALQALFETTLPFRPAIVLLRHLDGLLDSSGTAAGTRDAAAMRLAAALSQGITSGCTGPPPPRPPHLQSQAQQSLDAQQQSSPPLVVVSTVASVDETPGPLRRCFTHEVEAATPDEAQRRWLLGALLGPDAAAQLGDTALADAATQTAGLLPRDLRAIAADVVAQAAAECVDLPALLPRAPTPALAQPNGTSRQHPAASIPSSSSSPTISVHQHSVLPSSAQRPPAEAPAPGDPAPLQVAQQHLSAALERVRRRTATEVGAPCIPNVRWEDVGGLEGVKGAILDTVELPLKHPHLFAAGLRQRSGVLLYGPPGTGKTLLAKAVATECSINFLSVKGPELINMYIGESERQVREIFARAKRARPCVLFFDELDSLAPARGAGADSGGVMDRVVAQLLAEVDAVQAAAPGSSGSGGRQDVFIIGATNRPDLLDPALLRPGRLDTLLYVGVAEDAASKANVLRALTHKFRLAGDVDVEALAAACPRQFTGADMYGLCADAWMAGLKRTIAAQEAEQPQEVVEVHQADFMAALQEMKPSLSEDELQRYRRLKEHYEGQRSR